MRIAAQILLYGFPSFAVINFKSRLPGIYVIIQQIVDITKGPASVEAGHFSTVKMMKDKERKGERERNRGEGMNPLAMVYFARTQNNNHKISMTYNNNYVFNTHLQVNSADLYQACSRKCKSGRDQLPQAGWDLLGFLGSKCRSQVSQDSVSHLSMNNWLAGECLSHGKGRGPRGSKLHHTTASTLSAHDICKPY